MDEASLLKTCIRTPLDAKSDEVEGFSDDIEIMESLELGTERCHYDVEGTRLVFDAGIDYYFEDTRCVASSQQSVRACTTA